MKRYLPVIIIVAVLLTALAGASMMYRSAKPSTETLITSTVSTPPAAVARSPATAATPSPAATTASASTTPALSPDAHSRGVTGAPVTIEEFGDYQCPPCGLLHPELKKIEKEYATQARFVFSNFPLPQMHANALVAAGAAEAAGLQDRFWQMHDRLYDNQAEWNTATDARSIFIKYARELGLDANRFARDMDGARVKARIVFDLQRGQQLGVIGTPTLFINGQQLRPDMMTPDGIRAAINYVLNKEQNK